MRREHDVHRLELVLETGDGVVDRVGAVAEDHARVEQRARVDDHVARFFAEPHAVDDARRPVLAVAKARLVVVREHAEHGRAEADRRKRFRARSRELRRVFLADPVLVRDVHEQRDAGIHRGHHRGRAHGVDLHEDAGLLPLVERRRADVLSSFSLGPGTGVSAISPVYLIPIAAILRISARARLGRADSEPQRAGRDDPRSVDHALLDVIAQRDVALGRTAARENRGVAGLEQRAASAPSRRGRCSCACARR